MQELKGWSFSETAKQIDRVVGTVQAGAQVQERSEQSKIESLRNVWKASRVVEVGDPVWLYLNRRVGLTEVSPDIRFHPNLRYSEDMNFPAMVSMMRYPDGSGASIHRTYITSDGQKASVSSVKKFMQGKPLQTAAVRLSNAGTTLGIAEGIETALAASKRFCVPVWAATNATLLEAWVPPVGVERVLIAGDNDASYTGQLAAYGLARRLVQKGLIVEVHLPAYAGRDWADERI